MSLAAQGRNTGPHGHARRLVALEACQGQIPQDVCLSAFGKAVPLRGKGFWVGLRTWLLFMPHTGVCSSFLVVIL